VKGENFILEEKRQFVCSFLDVSQNPATCMVKKIEHFMTWFAHIITRVNHLVVQRGPYKVPKNKMGDYQTWCQQVCWSFW
jgi:hypothetical protein